ncbi:MAG: type VII secretion protein EssC [Promicromonosporaceae bacterium]|nr:type VII secretion protein EssC [Promicromonosporaceae bacterium]
MAATLVVFTDDRCWEFSPAVTAGEVAGLMQAFGSGPGLLSDLDPDALLAEVAGASFGSATEIAAGMWALAVFDEPVDLSTRSVVDGALRIGSAVGDHIYPFCVDGTVGTAVSVEGSVLRVWHDEMPVYLNGVRLGVGEHVAVAGDAIWVNRSFKVSLAEGYVSVLGVGVESRLNAAMHAPKRPEEYPVFKRPPRQVYRPPTDKVELKKPPSPPELGLSGLGKLIVPPVFSALLTAGMGFFMGQGLMMLMGAVMTVGTTITSVFSYFGERRERKITGGQEQADYDQYLRDMRKDLHGFKAAQEKAARYHYLTPAQIASEMAGYSSRVFERGVNDADFLTLSVGSTSVSTTYQVTLQREDDQDGSAKRRKAKKKSKKGADEAGVPLDEQVNDVLNAHQVIDDMPVVVDLKKAHLGLVGDPRHARGLLTSLLMELSFFQSYHDVEVVVLTDDEGRSKFEWARWLPHCRVKNINVTGLVSAENHRDQALGNLAQVLKQRSLKTGESKQDSKFLPHYVFVVDNPSLVINHSIMEFLQRADTQLGFSLIWATQMQANLPENIKTVLRLDGATRGTLVMNEANMGDCALTLPPLAGVDVEMVARRLAPLQHVYGVSTQIPNAVTFFELYGVKRPEEIPIAQLWGKSASHKSLAVPLGLRGKDDIVNLNLHEAAHGPHGLVAGTTGSGKSEIVQSYIISLAAYFHPYEVGFLLIDYKGGGMANLFDNLPHLLGTITNLDGAGSMRALASIKSELARRQHIFGEAGVNNINAYTKAFKAGEVTLPLPHLFIISDEFAELKKEQPDFMAELVSTARIGRSLGVHLILATQKPSGVVDDQIWSNSKFKLALKVADESDSNEVLKTPDAARITQPGRAYLQVGNNEIYELFQSAWSGAPYVADAIERGFDGRVYTINELGQGVLVNEDLSAVDAGTDAKQTQLDVMVDHIREVYEAQGCPDVEKPWLPPLEEVIVTPHIKVGHDVGLITEHHLTVPLGIADIPEKQTQQEFAHDFAKDGNLAVFGAAATGKSTTLTNLALTLAANNSPALCQFHVLDYGNSALSPLRGLPHTGNYLTIDNAEKLGKLIVALNGELKTRKQAFAKVGAHHFTMFNQMATSRGDKLLPAMIVLIDNFDVVAEASEQLDEFMVKLTRDGTSAGIYVVASASRPAAIRYMIQSNFKRKISHYLTDPTDLTEIAGRTPYTLTETQGRLLIKLEEAHVAQGYMPAEYTGDLEYITGLQETVEAIAAANTAPKAAGVRVLPDTVTLDHLAEHFNPDKPASLVGFCTETIDPLGIDPAIPYQLIIGRAASGKTNILKLLTTQHLGGPSQVFISDSPAGDLNEYANNPEVTYVGSSSSADEFIEALEFLVDSRVTARMEAGLTAREYAATAAPVFVLIDDFNAFLNYTLEHELRVENLLAQGVEAGITYVATTDGRLETYAGLGTVFASPSGAIILGPPEDAGSIIDIRAPHGYQPSQNIGFWVKRGQIRRVKIPKHPTQSENSSDLETSKV